ncbi:hypothetical protein LBMAG53_20940 [Planctomycetota bacterium]|nr:hypothetical protein LBMAG53_20940 [Planctomycetota bacterium]
MSATIGLERDAATLFADGSIDDLWSEGAPRLSLEPTVLDGTTAGTLAEAAVAVAMVLDAAVRVAAQDPIGLLRLAPDLARIAAMDAPRWLCLARADVFLTADPFPQVCEINSDTPTGLMECVTLGRLAAAPRPELRDPSAQLARRWAGMVRCAGENDQPVVGMLDPTDITEDLGHIRQLIGWLEQAGCHVVRGSPFNLHACPGGRIGLFGTPCDVLVRHYKSDWWARPDSPWRDVPPIDAPALDRELDLIAGAMAAGKVQVINPFGAAIAQNKRLMALPFEMPEQFSQVVLDLAEQYLPETRFLERMDRGHLEYEQDGWVLKSAYGAEGDGVVVGRLVTPMQWRQTLDRAMPDRWVAQRAFIPRTGFDGTIANHGVFLIGGAPSGLYTRRSVGPTDHTALSVPTLVTR